MKYHVLPNIRTPEELGIAYLGNPNTAIVPPKRHIDRAEYGRKLAELEGGIFAPNGYIVPVRNKRRNQFAK